MCEHQQRSIKHGHNNIMWLIFLCSPFHMAFCCVHIANDYTKLLMVNHNGSGWALYFAAASFSYPVLISPLSQLMVSKVNVTCTHPKTASTGARAEAAVWTSHQEPLLAGVVSLHSLSLSVVLQQELGLNTERKVATFLGSSTEK